MDYSISEIAKIWRETLKIVDERLNDRNMFDNFFANSYIYDIRGNTATVVVSSATAERLLSSKYIDIIRDAIAEVTDSNLDLVFVQQSSITKSNIRVNNTQKEESEPSFFKDARLRSELTFESFVDGEFNQEAYKAASVVAKNPGQIFNPLFIYSNSGLGKTHLLHAVGNAIKAKKPNTKVLYIDANDFVEEYVKFVKGEKDSETLKDFVCGYDVLLFDDVQFLENKVKTEEMFFYIYQKMVNSDKQIVITSDRQPNELKGLEDRLITRFSQGLTVKINDPDQNTCVKILEKQIKNAGLEIDNFDPAVLLFYADKFSDNVRELQGKFKRLIFYVSEMKQVEKIDLDVAIEAVQNITNIKNAAAQLSEQKIINVVSSYYKLSPNELTGKTRTGQIALARHIAMYLIRINIDIPLTKIGAMFGGRDHTTVMNGILKVENMLKTDESLKIAVNNLQKALKSN
ncbi:MAG: chromosomal replication initiator protein DnaA [Bacilli bacterium]|nr:chromosomal replication initiator protein DnaA [Bacilli bacterium]